MITSLMSTGTTTPESYETRRNNGRANSSAPKESHPSAVDEMRSFDAVSGAPTLDCRITAAGYLDIVE